MKRIALIAAAVLAALTFSAAPAAAQDTSDVFVLHGIPGLPVDIYVDGELTLENFQPEDVAGPLALAVGDYEVEIYAAGADPAADDPALALTASVPVAGLNASVIAHLTEDGEPTTTTFVNDNSEIDAGNGRVTIRHTAAAPAVDIVAGGAAVEGLTGLSNPNAASVELPAGDYPTGIAASGTTEALVDAPVTVVEGTHLIVYAIGDLAADTFTLLTQSFSGLGAESAPAVVNAGNSGLAAENGSSNLALVLVMGGILAAAVVAVPAVRLARRES